MTEVKQRTKFYKELVAAMNLLRIPATEYNKQKLQACEQFIAEHIGWVTPDMMSEAFNLYVAGELHMADKDDHYGTISAEWVCRLLNLYRKHEKRTEYNYTPASNQIEEKAEDQEVDLKASFDSLLEYYKISGRLRLPCIHLYDWAEENGIIKYTPKEKTAIFDQAVDVYRKQLREDEGKGTNEIRIIFDKMPVSNKYAIKTEAKYIALRQYFDTLLNKEK